LTYPSEPIPKSPGRNWNSQTKADGGLHSLGNGRLCAYAQGPHIVQVFGPPYSTPSLGQLRLETDDSLHVMSRHEPRCPVWRHSLAWDGAAQGDASQSDGSRGESSPCEIIDFVDSRLACLVRRVRSARPLVFQLTVELPARRVHNNPSGADGGWLFEVPAGLYFFHEYPVPLPSFYQFAWQGPLEVTSQADGLRLVCPPGETVLYLSGGPAYPQALETAEQALQAGFEALLERTRQDWESAARPRQKHLNLPLPADVLQAVEDTALLIQTQQAAEGGVLAGHAYHWAGVRDQYGVARGLLALGHTAEARRILEFYWDIWQRHGRLHNGMGIGVDAFHVHENDRVEITGYLVRQAFDLLEAEPGSEEFIDQIFPMLAWAFWSQAGELVDGMLPFNGDETYVAGGILPRYALNDGSAEATLLFLEGGEQLVSRAARTGRWDSGQLATARQALQEARARYRSNFFQDGRLITNQPRRAAQAHLPRFRHGVCERCLVEPSRPVAAIWTERSSSGRYLCPDCLAKGDFPPAVPRSFQLNSVSLVAFYLLASLLSLQDLAPIVNETVALYRQTGRLPSRPDEPDGLAVGYDYGLLLYALAALRHPEADAFCRTVLDLRDSAGAWAEYYRRGQPVGTRCRPWESAINLEAILKWREKYSHINVALPLE
jgi:hypothetical protein